jgi:lysophosphatidylcholine acyltransferase/lyso-PAF acetyltransferase
LILYPEGGTTNGTHLVNFKKGAFVGLNSIKPIIIKYKSPFLTIENCVYNFFAQSILCGTCPYAKVTITEMPVFTPNEFFWKNHMKEGEEKWETYARVIRELMAKEGGFMLADIDFEEKYKYKELIYGKGRHSD